MRSKGPVIFAALGERVLCRAQLVLFYDNIQNYNFRYFICFKSPVLKVFPHLREYACIFMETFIYFSGHVCVLKIKSV
jgi:hypothetical protein